MPPRKSTSSMTPAEEGDSLQVSPQQTQADKPITATEQQIKARAEAGVSVDDYLLPRSLTIRLAKAVLPPNTTIQKDAVLAIQKAATVFVSYLSSHANDATLKRTIAPTDVFSALTELEFDSFRARLEQELEAYTEIKAGKRKAKKSDVNGADAPTGEPAAKGDNEDAEMTDQPAKKMKRDDNVEVVIGGDGDGDETQEEEIEEEEADEEAEDEEEEEHEEKKVEDDIDRVEDLDGGSRPMDPDADETDDDDGPGSQLHNDLGLG
ncbi:Histone-fold [Penicillium cinerascens]|uniref:DNA polymerase epsilon subunit D n=1 Tax=Penicillium cinerascens TaxID=70096 RepID=A0A9W9TED9_9EURO|nr:Histone-fold [Penicillium cinerascens]KAJ5218525.1 Histone-fold [Penicillium cinerascens]